MNLDPLDTRKRCLYVYRYSNMGGVASVIKQRSVQLRELFKIDCAFIEDAGTGTEEWRKYDIDAHMMGKSFEDNLTYLVLTNDYDVISVIDTPEAYPIIEDYYEGKLIYEVHTSIPRNMDLSRNVLESNPVVIVPSNWSKNVIVDRYKCMADKVFIVPNVVDEQLFRYVPPDNSPSSPMILWVGKLDRYKNWRDALVIFKEVKTKYRDVSFKMLTGGAHQLTEQKKYITELVQYDLLGDVRRCHHVPYADMPRIYSAAARSGGALLNTSLHESFCMVVHEAWRCNLPVITTAVGPLEEIVEDGINGMSFSPGNVTSGAEKVIQILDSPDLREQIVEKGLETSAEYVAENALNAYLAALDIE